MNNSSLEELRVTGDELDVIRKRSLFARRGGMVAMFASVFIPNAPKYLIAPESFLTTPAYLAAGAVTVSGANLLAKRYYNSKLRRIRKLQEASREAFGDEEIDFVVSKKGRKREIKARWYGFDGTVEPGLEARRLSSVVEFMDQYGVKTVAIGADNLDKDMVESLKIKYNEDPSLTEVKGGRSYRRRHLIDDEQLDEKVIECTQDQAVQLAELLEESCDDSLISRLIRKAGDDKLLDALDALSKLNQKQLEPHQLVNLLARAVQRHLDSEVDVSMGEVLDDNLGSTMGRSVSSGVLYGTQILMINESLLPHGRQQTGSSVTSFAKYLGARNNQQLIERALDEATGTRRDALYSAYLVAKSRYDKLENSGKLPLSPSQGPRQTNESAETLLGRLHKSEFHPSEVGFWHDRVSRFGAAVSTAVAAGAFGIGVASVAGNLGTRAFSLTEDGYSAYRIQQGTDPLDVWKIDKYDEDDKWTADYRRYVNQASTLEKVASYYSSMSHTLYLADTDLAGKMATLSYKLGIGQNILDAIDIKIDEKWLADVYDKIDSTRYPDGTSNGVGDVLGNSNKELFRVTPLTGKSTQGYWKTDQPYSLTLTATRPSSKEGLPEIKFLADPLISTVGVTVLDKLPVNPDEVNKHSPDFVVETDLIPGFDDKDVGRYTTKDLRLPMLHGTQLVGVRITDANDLSVTIPARARLLQDGSVGVQMTSSQLKAMSQINVKKPILQYWIKETGKSYPSKQKPDVLSAMRQTGIDTEVVAKAVKNALGLSSNATDEQVLDAIKKNHTYSYTPFADQLDYKKPTYDIDDPQAALIAIGTVMAELDKMNCNLATATYLLATEAGQGQTVAVAGIHDDGDGRLSEKELHLWTENSKGEIIDPTPGGRGVITPPVEKLDLSASGTEDSGSSMPLVLSAAIAIGIFGAWRRKQIKSVIGKTNTSLVLKFPPSSTAYAYAEAARYSDGPPPSTPPKLPSRELSRKLGANFSPGGLPTAKEIDQHFGVKLTLPERMALRALNKLGTTSPVAGLSTRLFDASTDWIMNLRNYR